MTVCVAAIFADETENAGVAFTADRRFTDEGTNLIYTSSYPKWKELTESIVALVADDMALQAELLDNTIRAISKRNRQGRIRVDEVADLYLTAHREKVEQYFEQNVLLRYGLSYATWQQATLSESISKHILEQLTECRLPYKIETIIAGNDDEGAKIFHITENGTTPLTTRGYAAIGDGAYEAEAQFKLGGYSRTAGPMETLFLCYIAKRRAEKIGSVGRETDAGMTIRDICADFNDETLDRLLESEYANLEKEIKRYEKEARDRLAQWSLTWHDRASKGADGAPTKNRVR